MSKRRFGVFRSFFFSFKIVDPGDEVDGDTIAEAVYRETGIGTEWFPHRPGDTPKLVTTATTHDMVTNQESTTVMNQHSMTTVTTQTSMATMMTQDSTMPDDSECVIKSYTCPICKTSFKNKNAK